MPADEQQKFKRVGLALAFGVAFQTVCVFSGLTTIFGQVVWVPAVAFIIAGILYCYDSKFVASDWEAQGISWCRAHGAIPQGNWRQKYRRPAAIGVRSITTVFFAALFAIMALLRAFGPDIETKWEEDNRRQNSELVQAISAQLDGRLSDLGRRTEIADAEYEALGKGSGSSAFSAESASDIDRQIADRLDHVKAMQAAKDDAERLAAGYRADQRAEHEGVRLHQENTGLKGDGPKFAFYEAMVVEQGNTVRARAGDIDDDEKAIAELRRQRSKLFREDNAATVEQRDVLARLRADNRSYRESLSREKDRLQDDREAWISSHVRESPGFVHMPKGLAASLLGLWQLIKSNPMVASIAAFLKVFLMLAESAGPIAKIFFCSPGLYCMMVALRSHDAVESEADRRVRWEHWRIIRRSRSDDAIEAVRAQQRRRETESRARDAVSKIVDRFAWTK